MLSKRLERIAAEVADGARVCDVGTDHGYLPLSLVLSGRVRSVIACDINKKPLESAARNFAAAGVTDISLRLCDGLSGVLAGEADTVIIAGIGGEVIAGIISRCEWLRDGGITLILQPTTSPEKLREYLCLNGFEIKNESAVSDAGKVYSVIRAVFTGTVLRVEPYYYYIGALAPDSCDNVLYIKKQLKRCTDCCRELDNIERESEKCRMYRGIAGHLTRILGDTDAI